MSTKSKKSAVDAATKSEILNKASQVDVESIRTNLAAVKTQVARQLVDVEEELVVNAEKLQAVTAAIEIKQQEMKDLHGADQVLMSIDDLRVKLTEEKTKFEAAKKSLEAEAERLQEEVEAERAREQVEHQYTLTQARKRDEDAWNDQRTQRDRAEKLRIQDFERDLALRTAELSKKEADYAAALAQAETFDAKVAEAAAEKAADQVAAISRNHKHDVAITKAATDAEISNLKKDITHRDETIKTLQSELASVKLQLTNALTAQTELAKSTVDNAKAKEAYNEAMSTAAGMSGGNGQRTGRSS
jgi:hypothetical protein